MIYNCHKKYKSIVHIHKNYVKYHELKPIRLWSLFRLLNHGTLGENNIVENSKITLIPHLESGLSVSHDLPEYHEQVCNHA